MSQKSKSCSKSVLIVESPQFQRQLLAMVCEEAGFEATVAPDSRQALAALKAQPYRVVILCLELPDIDGMQLLRAAAKLKVKSKFILTSCHVRPLLGAAEQVAEKLGLRVMGTLHKPYVAERMLSILKDPSLHLSKRQPPSAQLQARQLRLSARDLRDGIRKGAVTPHYQPKIRQPEGSIMGLECLTRFEVASRGMVRPTSFIPTVEKHGLMRLFTDAVLHATFRDIAMWRSHGHDFAVSINISPDTLKEIDFPDHLDALAVRYDVEPSKVTLEITESKAIDELGDSLEVMIRLRLKGFGLSIDDFGTGYASLKQMQYSPFTELKLDRSYVASAVRHQASHAVLESGIRLARDLSLSCVAEGVETMQQADMLDMMGCGTHQGYLYARPMPGGSVEGWMEDWSANHKMPPLNQLPRPSLH